MQTVTPGAQRTLLRITGLSLWILLALPGTTPASEPVATFSIVGADPAAGEVGIAVQSKFFAVGAVVPWAKAGVGAIATQAFANTAFGPRGLELLADGRSVPEVLEDLLAEDDRADRRQVGIVSASGAALAHTGENCLPWAGHLSGDGFSAQGNILVSGQTVKAMAGTFLETSGMLGERLMSALEAGQAAGGDSRGVQSAAILVVKAGGGYGGYDDRYCDLRVDDHVTPIAELRRIFDIWKVDALIREGYTHMESGDFAAALAAGKAASSLDTASGEPHFHLACYYSRAGQFEDALRHLKIAAARDPALVERAKTDTDLDPLRSEPGFAQIVGETE